MAKIVVYSAVCSSFGTGFCWSARNPYWDGHYKTKREAFAAARKTKKKVDESLKKRATK